ncbi:transcriptional regulator [Pantoea agglomerans]|uniref:Transcriptional regulator n=1 Tax=Enterobacter agglomerans TaxID=549 RepID=A0A379AA84_ENTAG|nr:transcriptional regulator [Pantoea agglomerans]
MTSDMLREYPGLSVNLVTGVPAPDLIADGLDLVIRVGALKDSSLFSRRLGCDADGGVRRKKLSGAAWYAGEAG